MKAKKEVVTIINIVDAYKRLFNVMGKDNTIETFQLCTNYGFWLCNSTIDKIELTKDGRIYFYYNENTGDCDPIENFSYRGLKSFYNNLVDAWNEEQELEAPY